MSETNSTPFSALNLREEIARAVEQMGFETATDIQAQSIPLIRAGYDVIGRSQTGTGKTLAFGIPALETVESGTDRRDQVQVLILCPTRELAVQACGELKKLAGFMHGIRAAEVYGGAPMDRQILKLKRANIVVGTPGRVMDHMRRRTLRLDGLKMVVLDEADEMLSMGFREDIETILKDAPEERQTILFSATMPKAILDLTKQYQKDPQIVEINKNQVTVSGISQSYYEVPAGKKLAALKRLLRYESPERTIIFCNTKKMVDEVSTALAADGFSAEGLHGDMKQVQRLKVMDAFKQGRTAVLIATDVAARGIDVHDIDVVINYDVPQNPEYYVHRIGRTGRAGKDGRALTLCGGRRQVSELLEIGRTVKSDILRKSLPKLEEMEQRRQNRAAEQLETLLAASQADEWTPVVDRLVQKGYSPEQLAALLLKQQYGGIAEEEIEEIREKRPYPAKGGGRYGKLIISVGRKNKITPNHLVGAVAEQTGLPGREIGKIEIQEERSLVAVPENYLDEAAARMQGQKICGIPVAVTAWRSGKRQGKPRGGSENGRRKASSKWGGKPHRDR